MLSCCKTQSEPDIPVQSKFTSDVRFIKAGGIVQFTDQSSGNPTQWLWTFEGGIPATSTDKNPNINYSKPGFYTVILESSNEVSSDTETKEYYITVGCDGDNCDAIFSGSIVTTGVVYGIDQDQHQLNLFEPEGDVSTSRPLVILFGGGAFSGSNLALLEPLARELNEYGFVVAAARYRNGPQSEGAQNMIRGNQDTRAAVRYFRKAADQWRIDPNKIFVGGNGTGAFISLIQSYLDINEVPADFVDMINSVGGLEGDQGNAGYSSVPLGCISLAGGMYVYGDLSTVISSDDVPLFAVHGTADSEVPYDTQTGNPNTYGGLPITKKVRDVGLISYLYTIQGGGHDAPRSNPQLYINQLITWCYLVMH